MATLPVPARIFFNDFAFELVDYSVKRNSEVVSSASGLPSDENGRRYIAFLMDASIICGDILTSDSGSFEVTEIAYDSYNGKPDMIKAYY
ncbi:hypothetical protein PAALTS15_10005 [Paenibacillus alvei TS-15]|uniref:Uncharacterized protein n=1 Tax=Paenibacillus alvei TS-15 TaxID=1117108 RepID=S9UAE4_PAEAL|nr:hypothetical protein [Paenibacillus alvei]EPY07450.1 hypothetical protein PAALTS15_10005 [Paenibacillus alvei TS-15]